METIKLGLIGAGGIANAHCRAFSGIENAEIIAASDISKERAERTANQWNIPKIYPDYNEMIKKEELDAVIVCTPTAVHAAPAIAALMAGKHVLCEKPMEASLKAATEMVRAAHDANKILMVALKLRFSPTVIKAKQIVEAGTLGSVYYVETVADRRRGNPGGSFIRKSTAGFGAAADIGVYALDTALYLMGHPKPIAVSGMTSNYLSTQIPRVKDTEVEDFATAWVLFENGARMVFKTCWCMNMDSIGGTIFLGTRAGLRLGVGEVRGPQEGITLYREEFGEQVSVNIPSNGNVDVFKAEDTAFVDAVRNGKPSPIDPEGVLLTNVVIQGVIDSENAGGREVEVKVPAF